MSGEGVRTRHPAEAQTPRRVTPGRRSFQDEPALDEEEHEESDSPPNQGMDCSLKIVLIMLVVSNICLGIELSLFGPLVPELAKSKGQSLTILGLERGTFYLSSLAFLPFLLIQLEISAKHFLFVGATLLSFSASIFGAIHNMEGFTGFTVLVLVSRLFEGTGAGILRSSTYMMVVDQFPSNIWKIFAILDASFSFGMTIGPIIGGYLLEVGGFAATFYFVGGLIFLVAIINAIILPEPGDFEPRSLSDVWNLMKKPPSLVYFSVIFVCYYFTGFLEVTLETHLSTFAMRVLYVGMFFAIPDATCCVLSIGWGRLVQKKLSPVMVIFLATLLALPSALLIGPVNFIESDTNIYLIAIALLLKGISQSQKNVCSFYGSYMDAVARGHNNDVVTHSTIFIFHTLATTLGGLIGASTAGVLYENIGFKDSTLILLALEILLVPGVLTYGLLRPYRRPINFHSSGESRPLLSSLSSSATVS